MDLELKNQVWELKRDLGSWAELSRQYGGSAALYWKIANGKILESPTARALLGMEPRLVEVEPCRVCGGIHIKKTCSKKRKKRKRQYTVAFRFDNPEDAKRFRRVIGSNREQWAHMIMNTWGRGLW
jgi:hypothetical protein